MTADELTRSLVQSLRVLRKSQGDNLEERLLQNDTLLVQLGSGSLNRTMAALCHIRRKYATDREGDIPAFFFTVDHRSPSATLDSRLMAYARRFHVDERTALRRSDRGARKIAEIARQGFRYDRPWVVVILAQDETGIRCFFRGSMPPGSDWTNPVVYLNGSRVRDLTVTKERDRTEGREWFRVELPRMELDWTVGEHDAMGTLVIAWQPGLTPMWDLVSYLPDYRIYARLSTEDSLMAEVTVRRWATTVASAQDPPGVSSPSCP